jgi:hypothetical protein
MAPMLAPRAWTRPDLDQVNPARPIWFPRSYFASPPKSENRWMMPAPPRLFALIPILALLCACATSKPAPAEPEAVEGLVRVPATRVDTVLAAPGVSLANYHRVMLDPVEVGFVEGWEQRSPGVTADDITRIRSQAGAAFREIFGFALSANGGYGLTTQPDPDVLRVSTTISNLDVGKSPADATTVRPAYVVSSADLVLLMDLRDSRSGTLLVRAIDRGRVRQAGDMRIEDSVTNSTDARRALEMWARLLREALDEARADPAGATPQ